jgi:DNA primase
MASILNRKPKEGSKATFELPTYLLSGFASENSLKMALKYDLLEAYGSKVFRTDYDPRLDRQVFYYRNNRTNAVVGAMGRALRPHNRPKALIYPNSQKTPWICGKFDEAVIVEDIFSAVKCYNIGKTGIALSGTTLAVEYLTLFKDYTKVYICLDKDASLKALDMKKLLDIFNKSVIVRLLDKDIKDLTRDEARKLFV